MTRRSWLDIARAAHELAQLTGAAFRAAQQCEQYLDDGTAPPMWDRAESADILASELLAEALHDAEIFTEASALKHGFKWCASRDNKGLLIPVSTAAIADYAEACDRENQMYEACIPF